MSYDRWYYPGYLRLAHQQNNKETHTMTQGFTAQVAKVDGVEYAVGTPFLQAVNERAHERGLAAFRVYKNGVEITGPNTAPTSLNAGDDITIQPYDKAGHWTLDI